jgi:phosphoglycerol transferase MdoB-like AlkP superfamily enzyme
LPNLFKEKYPNSVTSYFHNNSLDYYSRSSYLQKIGFDNLYGMKETNHQEGDYLIHHNMAKSEKMLIDSKMMEASKEKMFPEDQQFFTFWMTLTMHGPYDFNRSVFDENKQNLESFNHKISNELLNYTISLMDFDKALGTMFNYLEYKNLLDKTTIVLTGDHDTYMNNLSLNVKNKNRLEMETYQIPLFIYDKQLDYSLIENKFTSTQTILPTILDLFNIPYYKEFYLNDSLFRSNNQYLYSYGFGFFIDKNGLFMTLKDKKISSELITERKKLLNCFIKRQQIFDCYNKYYKTKKSILQ